MLRLGAGNTDADGYGRCRQCFEQIFVGSIIADGEYEVLFAPAQPNIGGAPLVHAGAANLDDLVALNYLEIGLRCKI